MKQTVTTEALECGCIYRVERLPETPSYNGVLTIKVPVTKCGRHRFIRDNSQN